MNYHQKILHMLQMQDAINIKTIGEDWRNQDIPWCRAIWIECAELMDHYGWKWWKKQAIDRDQVVLELVDIWHFGISEIMSIYIGSTLEKISFRISPNYSHFLSDPLDDIEQIARECLSGKFSVYSFFSACNSFGVSFDELYKTYVGKNVLNEFRQDNGYTDGSYRKLWAGEEDNIVLSRIIKNISDDLDADETRNEILKQLAENYAASEGEQNAII